LSQLLTAVGQNQPDARRRCIHAIGFPKAPIRPTVMYIAFTRLHVVKSLYNQIRPQLRHREHRSESP
jgi:hypothetical protein